MTSVTNDTNVTGSIASNDLTLGWAGTLAVARGGIGANSFLSAGLAVLTGGNTFSGLNSFTSGLNVTGGAAGNTFWGSSNDLVISPSGSGGIVYLNYYQTGGTKFCSGAGGGLSASVVASVSPAGDIVALGAGKFQGNVCAALAGTPPRQQLSVGTYLDIYSDALSNSPTTNSIRAWTGGIAINAAGAGSILFNCDTGTGPIIFQNAGATVAQVSATGGAFQNGVFGARQQLSVGTGLDLYTSATALPPPSLRFGPGQASRLALTLR